MSSKVQSTELQKLPVVGKAARDEGEPGSLAECADVAGPVEVRGAGADCGGERYTVITRTLRFVKET